MDNQKKGPLDSEVKTLKERDLITYCSHGVVHHLRLVMVRVDEADESDKYAYQTWVGIKGEKQGHDEFLLVSHRKEPRLWLDLNRYMLHIRDNYKFHGHIAITLLTT